MVYAIKKALVGPGATKLIHLFKLKKIFLLKMKPQDVRYFLLMLLRRRDTDFFHLCTVHVWVCRELFAPCRQLSLMATYTAGAPHPHLVG